VPDFRQKCAMSTRYLRSQDSGLGWTARILLAILALVILGAIALGIYAGTLRPPHQIYHVVIPSARFAN
jgi:hypothetical protein